MNAHKILNTMALAFSVGAASYSYADNLSVPSQSDWEEMGAYFPALYAHSPEWNSDKNNTERLNSLKFQYMVFENYSRGLDPAQYCIPLAEGYMLQNVLESSDGKITLTPEQTATLDYIGDLQSSPAGNTVIEGLISEDLLICVHDTIDNQANLLAAINTAEYRMTHEETNDESGQYSIIFNALTEELMHGFQLAHWGQLEPLKEQSKEPSNEQKYNRVDERLWMLFVEAHAKVMTSVMMAEMAIEEQSDIPQTYLDLNLYHANTEMLEKTLSIYEEHGADAVRADASLLTDVFLIFFQHRNAMSNYAAQGAHDIQNISPVNHDRIGTETYIEQFGKIEGLEGNMLRGLFEHITPYDLVTIMPNLPMKSWFESGISALDNLEALPDIPCEGLYPKNKDPKKHYEECGPEPE